ncbi:MAG TPA: hypothetical protein VIY86_09665 [Pirellulaceae bacterium]
MSEAGRRFGPLLPQVPSANGEGWVWPGDPTLSKLFHDNAVRLATASASIADRPLSAWRDEARTDLLRAASEYVSSYGDFGAATRGRDLRRIVLTGHQPELFHPGVWFKNFVAHRLAERENGVAVHVIADQDLCRSATVRAPDPSGVRLNGETIPLDTAMAAIPFEERQVLDCGTLAAVPDRLAKALKAWVPFPIACDIWPDVLRGVARHGNLGWALGEARHRLEQSWGLATLEVPLSRICAFPSFAAFLVGILDQLSDFQRHYHDSLEEYRRLHRVRSRTHPAPELKRDGEWWETPFWIWTENNPDRRPLWVRGHPNCWELRGRPEPEPTDLAVDPPIGCVRRGGASAVEDLVHLAKNGIRIRPRALTMTMFARLFLGDLFLHGLGGAQYDRMTDRIIKAFFGLEAPAYGAATATFRLPIPRPSANARELARVEIRLRELWYQPDRFLRGTAGGDPPLLRDLLENKAILVQAPPAIGDRHAWHQQLMELNSSLRGFTESERSLLEGRRSTLRADLRRDQFLFSREHPYCYFSEENLRRQLLDLSAASA